MHPAYFETLFDSHGFAGKWPAKFAIITARATTGACWTPAVSHEADRQLDLELQRRGCWRQRLTGYSPTTGHAEPGWAVDLGFDEACELGKCFLQDAIYVVDADELYVSHCDERRDRLLIGKFRRRLRAM